MTPIIPEFVDQAEGLATKVLSWVATATGIYGLWRLIRARVANVFSSMLAASSMSHAFGPTAGKKLQQITIDLQRRMTMAESLSRAKEAHLQLAMYVCDSSGGCISANRTLCDLFGMSEQNMLGSGWMQAIEPEERINCDIAWKSSIQRRIPYAHQYHVKLKTGERKLIYTEASEVVSGQDILCYIGFCKEIKTG